MDNFFIVFHLFYQVKLHDKKIFKGSNYILSFE